MRAVIQKVSRAKIVVDGQTVSEIGPGLLALIGIGREDGEKDMAYLADKIPNLRIFEDGEGKLNRSVSDVGGEILLVSQFTLYGNARHGRRPSFIGAAPPEEARPIYERLLAIFRERGIPLKTGIFQAHMEIELVNDGPVTLLLDSKKGF
ncbi:D-aminoacyl-tRNA deacylase [Gehongia tenuis]|uniref:D-aminoacyl-tRNA deacylase n=1 Tax=Gehongia tenuis TaxID=2763655 RepID=A0A926HPV1_9FIRM|nr:D-aminoacyl-tRNA deacylase [Gehongia tenuis]MBC8531080.1 D-tyrosyl-tRNA(Tyr) deacylase [Gehongia tenuis]